MATDQRPRRREDFRIAVLCALRLEFNAAAFAFDELFDEEGDKFGRARGDTNTYTTGRIGKYNVVMALLPSMGTVSSASAMASFRSSYTELKLALLVGICGGVPSPGTEKEILLGDVIISKTVVQYDFGRQYPHRFATKDTLSDSLGRPNRDIRSLLASLETERNFERLERRTAEILLGIQQTAAQAERRRTRYPYPGSAQDELFSPNYEHKHRDDADCGCDDTWICDTAPDASCIELECDKTHLVFRESLDIKKKLGREGNTAEAQKPHILIGSVGSGNTVMKSGAHRDKIAQRYDLIAFEMEAAGAWDEVPCVVIKGVCDYADSHKNKKWQTFAAATAASSMKALLELYIQTDSPGNSRLEFTTQRINEILTWISKEPYEQHHRLNKSEVLEGTGKWLLKDEVFQSWKNSETSSILWLHGIPGSGKSKLTSLVVEDALQSAPAATVYFYCSRNPAEPGRSNPTSIVASIARQLAMPQPGADILGAAVEAYRKFEEKAFASQSLTLGESEGLIHKLLHSYRGQKITLIIDALDECKSDTRQDLLDFLVSLLEATTTMKVFVSSRDDRDIVNELDRYRNLHLSSERNSGDIDLFVRSETRRLVTKGSLLRGSWRKEELRDKIVHELISNAHGMFRWASLHIQELCRQATDAAIEERLVRMPRTLEGLYREILERVENRDAVADRTLAKNALSWILCARETLRSGVFLAMVCRTKDGTPPTVSTDQLLTLCNDLVLFDDTLDVFRFSHLSVREFLEGQEGYGMTSAHALAAEQCLFNLVGLPSRIMPLAPLLEYSSFFWADHAKYADHEQRQSRLGPILTNFFSGEQDSCSTFRRWYDLVASRDDSIFVDYWSNSSDKFDNFNPIISYTPYILLVICAFDLSGVLSPRGWIELAKTQPKNLDGATHEELVLRHGSIRVLQWHFDAGVPFNMSKKHVKLIAAIEEHGADMLLLLLERFATKIKITQEVLLAAVSNKECGDRILTLLLDRRGHEIDITDEIVRAAVQNPRKAVEITSLLLTERERQICITPDIVMAAIQNLSISADVMKLLLDERKDEVKVSADVVLGAVRGVSGDYLEGRFKPLLLLLLDRRRDQIHITEDFIIGIASTAACSIDVMALLLDECRDDMQIARGLVDAVIHNVGGRNEVMGLLIDRLGAKSQISDRLLETIMVKFNAATVRKFIHMNGNVVKVTSEMVEAAVLNWNHGKEMMAMLLSEHGDDIRITEDIIEAVFENEFQECMIMGLLLDERTHEIQITEEFVKRAVQSEPEMLILILDKRGDQISITDDIMESCSTGEMIEIIMENTRHEIQITEKILIRAAEQENLGWGQDGGLLQLLLDTRFEEIRITEDIVTAATGNSYNGLRFMKLLLDRCGDDIVITKQILIAAASNIYSGDQIMALLLNTRGGSIRITPTVVEAAVSNWLIGHRVMAVLFEGRNDGVPVTERIFLLAVENHSYGDKLVEMLLDNVKDNVQITDEIVSVAVQNQRSGSRIMEILLKRFEEHAPITNETVRLAAGNEGCGDKIIALLLERCRGNVLITGEVLEAATSNPKCGHRVLASIFDTPGVIDDEGGERSVALQTALYDASRLGHRETVEVVLRNNADVDAVGGCFGTPLQVASYFGHLGVIRLLLQKNADVNAKGGVFGYALQAAASCGSAKITQMLLQNGANVHAQGGMENNALYAASLGGHNTVVRMLLQKNADCNTQGGRLGNALQAALSEGHQETAQILLDHGAEASCDSGYYGGAIQAASAGGLVKMVSLLHSEYSVGLDCSNRKFGRTALSYAAGGGHSSVVELLLADANVKPSTADHIGRTPLFFAAQKGHAEIVSTLAERDPSAVDLKDRYGITPLSVAARGGHIAVVRALLATNDIDIDSRDCFGRTSLSWARMLEPEEMSLLLEGATKGDLPPEDHYSEDTDSQLSSEDTGTPFVLDCDICTSSIPEDDTCYQCPDCNDGEFRMCKDCYDDCAGCLVASHEPTMTVAETPLSRATRLLKVDPTIALS